MSLDNSSESVRVTVGKVGLRGFKMRTFQHSCFMEKWGTTWLENESQKLIWWLEICEN